MYVEIEKKYQVLAGSLDGLLGKFQYKGEMRVIDEYFDTVDGHYYQDGIFIRIRNGSSLDIKFNPDHLGKSGVTDHVSCHEYSFEEPLKRSDDEKFHILERLIGLRKPAHQSFQGLLADNQLQSLLTIDKIRKTYQTENYTLVIDKIAGLGMFLEIEYSGPQEGAGDLDQILSEIDGLMEGVSAKPLSTGSFEMVLKQQDPVLYKKGKYLLAGDQGREVA